LLISAGAIEGYFEGKPPREGKVTKRVLFLHDNAPTHRAAYFHFIHAFGNGRWSYASEPIAKSVE